MFIDSLRLKQYSSSLSAIVWRSLFSENKTILSAYRRIEIIKSFSLGIHIVCSCIVITRSFTNLFNNVGDMLSSCFRPECERNQFVKTALIFMQQFVDRCTRV